MKKWKLMVVLLIVANVTYSQKGAFYMAKDLHSLYNNATMKIPFDASVKSALEKDVYKGTKLTLAILNTNPFFKDLFEDASGAAGNAIASRAMQSLSGLDITKYANALADVMIERAKQELTVAFFNRFKKFATENNPEFQILFPKTTANLMNLVTYSYTQMLPALRTAFFEDLKQLTYQLDDVLELPRYRHLLNNFPEVRVAIRSVRLIHDLEDGTSTAADLIKSFSALEEWEQSNGSDFRNMGSAVKLAAIFSEGLRNENESEIWVSAKEVKKNIKDEVFVRIYMGLIYQYINNKDIKFYLGNNGADVKTLTAIIEEHKNNILLFQNKISEFINLADKVSEVYKTIRRKQDLSEKVTNEDIYNYIDLSTDITDYAFSIIKIFEEELVTDKYIFIVKKCNSLYKDIYSEQYTKALNDAVEILKEVHQLTKKNTSAETIAQPAYAMDKKKSLERLSDFIRKVKPYGLFMANMVEAKTENEVKAALENVILPVGSSSIKKNTMGNISIQSYLGAYLTVSQNKNALQGSWSDRFGVTAPVGISWTPDFFSWQKGGSLSLYTALFDIGAIVDYKLKKEPDPTSTDPNATVIDKDYRIELGQIFSPGIYAVYGLFHNLPLSLGFGAQYGPGLSKIEVGNNTVITNPSWRWNLFLAVDLPLFNLFNKPKDKE